VVRHIGEERERFLAWYDHPGREEMRDRVGHPVTLWKKFASEVIKAAEHNNYDEPAEDHERPEHNNDEDDHNNNGDEKVEARTDAERMAMRGRPSSVERVVLTCVASLL
jgi:hypothetical protein